MKEGLQGWIRSIVCCLCLMQIAEQILPSGNYRKYIRLFCGMLFLVILLTPLTERMALGQIFEEQWENALRLDAWDSLSMEQEHLEDLRNETVNQAYEKEIQRQICEIALAEGMEKVQTELKFQDTEGWEIKEVRILGNCKEKEEKTAIQQKIRQQLLEIYQIKTVVFLGGS